MYVVLSEPEGKKLLRILMVWQWIHLYSYARWQLYKQAVVGVSDVFSIVWTLCGHSTSTILTL